MALRPAAVAVLVVALAAGTPGPRWRVPDSAVDFERENGTETLKYACGGPTPLTPAIRRRLHFFAYVSSENPALLRHFLAFYEGLGVDFRAAGRARLVANPPLQNDALTEVLATVARENVVGAASYSSNLKRAAVNSYIKTLPADGLLMYPDLDEFFDARPSAIADAADAQDGFVLGHMVDRVAADWALRAVDRATPPNTQFPRRCAVTRDIAGGENMKWILVPAVDKDGRRVKFSNSHHVRGEHRFPPRRRNFVTLPFSHYRFDASALALLDKKRALYGNGTLADPARAAVYDRNLARVDRSPPVARLDETFREIARCGAACIAE